MTREPDSPAESAPAAASTARSDVRVRRVALILLSVATVIWLLRFMQPVLLPLVLAGLLFYALDGAVDALERVRIPRAIGAALALVLLVGSLGALAYGLQGQVLTVIDQLPEGAQKLAVLLRTTPGAEPGALEKVQQAADALQSAAEPSVTAAGVTRVQIEEPAFQASTAFWSGSIGLLSAANQVVVVLFLTYFMLLSDQLFKRKLVEIVGTLSKKKVTVTVLEDIAQQIQRFLIIQLSTSVVVAIVTGIVLWAMGLEQAAFWGLTAGIFNSIPYYGPLLVTAGLSVVGFVQFGTLGMTAAVAGVALLITTLEGSLLTPALLGNAAAMNKVAVFAGLLFWSWMWGVWGLLLAVPMMMVVKVICDRVESLQPVGHLLGE